MARERESAVDCCPRTPVAATPAFRLNPRGNLIETGFGHLSISLEQKMACTDFGWEVSESNRRLGSDAQVKPELYKSGAPHSLNGAKERAKDLLLCPQYYSLISKFRSALASLLPSVSRHNSGLLVSLSCVQISLHRGCLASRCLFYDP